MVVDALRSSNDFQVHQVEKKDGLRKPPAPFTTSSLTQEASKKLGFTATRTMKAAQELYEGSAAGEGLITYMRTDGLQISESALMEIRDTVKEQHGGAYLPEVPRRYKSRAKNAQEAHEAIRPTQPALQPQRLPQSCTPDQCLLYDLIWRRTLASQMVDARTEQVVADIAPPVTDPEGQPALMLRATETVMRFPGYLAVYDGQAGSRLLESEDDDNGEGKGGSDITAAFHVLDSLKEGQTLELVTPKAHQHFTKGPARYTEGSLVKALEEKGIGRPSTYAPVMRLLQDRGYVVREKRALKATSLGRIVTAFLSHYFTQYVDYKFTSQVEDQLDQISAAALPWQQFLSSFWLPFNTNVNELQSLRTAEVFDVLNEEMDSIVFGKPQDDQQEDPRLCPRCGARLTLKPSRVGLPFIGCSNYKMEGEAKCTYTRSFGGTGSEHFVSGDVVVLGLNPKSGKEVSLRQGPYGLYVQEGDEDPIRRTVPKSMTGNSLGLEAALELLAGGVLGQHPEDGHPVEVKRGPFGPYIYHRGLSVPLPKDVRVSDVTFAAALELLNQKVNTLVAKGKDVEEVRVKALERRAAKLARSKGASSRGRKKKSSESSKGSKSSKEDKKSKSSKSTKSSKEEKKSKSNESTKDSKSSKSTKDSKSNERDGSRPSRLSGYHVFMRERRPSLAGAPLGQVTKELAAQWKVLEEHEKEHYKEMARRLNQAEKQAEVPLPEIPQTEGSPSTSKSSSTDEGSKKMSRKQTAPLNAYQQFCQVTRPQVVAEFPGIRPTEVMKQLAARWRAMPEAAREEYRSPTQNPTSGKVVPEGVQEYEHTKALIDLLPAVLPGGRARSAR